jgi:hypothetical protein
MLKKRRIAMYRSWYPVPCQPFPYRQTYPPVNTQTLHASLAAFQQLSSDAAILLKKLGEEDFAIKLMTAAQMGSKKQVDDLIKSAGVSSSVTASYTPTAISLTLKTNAQGTQCCTLAMYLKWGR